MSFLLSVQGQPSSFSKGSFLSKLIDFSPKFEDKTLSVCPHETKEREFLIIGHAGGDPYQACENTIAATQAALQRSMSHGLRFQNDSNLRTGAVKCLVIDL